MTVRKKTWRDKDGRARWKWMIHISYTHPDGRRESIRKVSPAPTRRGAEQYERDVRAALASGAYGRKEEPEREVPTFRAFAVTFIETYCKTNNRPSTVREKRRALGRGLLSQMGNLRLNQIGAREVEAFKARRKSEGVCNKTINEELAILSKLLDFATEVGDLRTAPPRIRRLKTQPPPFDFFDFDEAARLARAAREASDPWNAMVQVAPLTGLRLGELRGLWWDDVDLVAGRLHVRRSADDEGELGPPKNGRSRVVDLPAAAIRVLRAHKHLRGPFVFCREGGTILQRWHCESKSKRQRDDSPLMKICRRAGLRRMGWHGLRHTYASHLMMRGATPNEVMVLLGHSSITMTMRYVHLSPSARKSAVALLDQPAPQHIGSTGSAGP